MLFCSGSDMLWPKSLRNKHHSTLFDHSKQSEWLVSVSLNANQPLLATSYLFYSNQVGVGLQKVISFKERK